MYTKPYTVYTLSQRQRPIMYAVQVEQNEKKNQQNAKPSFSKFSFSIIINLLIVKHISDTMSINRMVIHHFQKYHTHKYVCVSLHYRNYCSNYKTKSFTLFHHFSSLYLTSVLSLCPSIHVIFPVSVNKSK